MSVLLLGNLANGPSSLSPFNPPRCCVAALVLVLVLVNLPRCVALVLVVVNIPATVATPLVSPIAIAI